MNGNYIKIDRGILDWEWYKNENTLCLFLHCLLKANWKDGRFEGVEIPRGSFATSISSLSKELGISYQSIRTSLNHLKSTGELTVTTYPKFSVITVNNYCLYQDINSQSNNQLTGDQQATNRQLTGDQQATNNNRRKKEGNKESKEEGKNNIGRFTPPTPNEVKEYCINGGYNIDPDAFVDFYESKGWMVGKNKMKDWKAAVRTWARSDNKTRQEQTAKSRRQEQTADVYEEWERA